MLYSFSMFQMNKRATRPEVLQPTMGGRKRGSNREPTQHDTAQEGEI